MPCSMARHASRADRAFSSHRSSSAVSRPRPSRYPHSARSRSSASVLAASRAPGGMPSRLPMEPGEAAMTARCCARVRPVHQAWTSAGVAPAPGAAARAASAGSSTPAYLCSTWSRASTRRERLAHRLLLGDHVGDPRVEVDLEAADPQGAVVAGGLEGRGRRRGCPARLPPERRDRVDEVGAFVRQRPAALHEALHGVGVLVRPSGHVAQGERHRVRGAPDGPDRLVVRRRGDALPVGDPRAARDERAQVVDLCRRRQQVGRERPDRVGLHRERRDRPRHRGRRDHLAHRTSGRKASRANWSWATASSVRR